MRYRTNSRVIRSCWSKRMCDQKNMFVLKFTTDENSQQEIKIYITLIWFVLYILKLQTYVITELINRMCIIKDLESEECRTLKLIWMKYQ